ncbi:hypothetical protein [Halovivax cerinus]|uniref:Uncharacterized protein n=1 Tax=Halovivax cerinus TaxID=1487865 RepID=A0ABD5NKW5_9EURY|nr:hypothetical protein [Halovivax cerinus]
MDDGTKPTEEYDDTVSVRLLPESGGTEDIPCSSYTEAIRVVRAEQEAVPAAKIVDRDGEVVFTSADMDIDDWEVEWKQAKRRLSVDVEVYDCPYDSVACFADDLCVQCKMDKVQNQY